MRAALAACGMASLALVALAACRTTQGDAAATKNEALAPPSAVDASLADSAADAGTRQSAHFMLFTSDSGKKRRFLPGVVISRIDFDGGSTTVAIDPPPDDGTGQSILAGPLTPGHYRAHFLVAACGPSSDGGCRPTNPRPDDAEFDVPASGDVEVTVR